MESAQLEADKMVCLVEVEKFMQQMLEIGELIQEAKTYYFDWLRQKGVLEREWEEHNVEMRRLEEASHVLLGETRKLKDVMGALDKEVEKMENEVGGLR